jgi:hypothetical protein
MADDKPIADALDTAKAGAAAADGGENAEVVKIIAGLREVQEATQARRLDPATSDADRERLKVEYNNVNTRILRLQAALFKTATQDISGDVDAIARSSADLKKAIKDIGDLNAALGGIAGLLGIVDNVLGMLA